MSRWPALVLAFLMCAGCQKERAKTTETETRPHLGGRLAQLPPGPAKAVADERCLPCHSAEIINQQRLTEKQWTAVVDKMIRWGTELDETQRTQLLAYLAQNFGPENNRFAPIETQPVQ